MGISLFTILNFLQVIQKKFKINMMPPPAVKRDRIIDFLRGEFIGEEVEIVDSRNKNLIGIKGRIVNETKNMFEIEVSDKNVKKVPKKDCKFRFLKEKLVIDGGIINCRPEDRISKKFKGW